MLSPKKNHFFIRFLTSIFFFLKILFSTFSFATHTESSECRQCFCIKMKLMKHCSIYVCECVMCIFYYNILCLCNLHLHLTFSLFNELLLSMSHKRKIKISNYILIGRSIIQNLQSVVFVFA